MTVAAVYMISLFPGTRYLCCVWSFGGGVKYMCLTNKRGLFGMNLAQAWPQAVTMSFVIRDAWHSVATVVTTVLSPTLITSPWRFLIGATAGRSCDVSASRVMHLRFRAMTTSTGTIAHMTTTANRLNPVNSPNHLA